MKGFIEVHEIEFFGEVRKRLLNVMFISNVEKHDTANVEITGFGNRFSTDGIYHITIQEDYEDVITRIKEAKDEVSTVMTALKELDDYAVGCQRWAEKRLADRIKMFGQHNFRDDAFYDSAKGESYLSMEAWKQEDLEYYHHIMQGVRNKIAKIRRREQKK